MEATEAVDVTRTVLRNVVRLLPPLAALGVFLLLFGPATYRDVVAGRLGDAVLGSVVLVLVGGGGLFWLYKRATTVRREI